MVSHLCRESFLSLWSYPNPQRRDGRELCDVLVVCDPDIIIFSVKNVGFVENDTTGERRWYRRAVQDSVRQIYGAERELRNLSAVIRSDGSPGLKLPDPERRRIHRVAVAMGSNREVSLYPGNAGKGYVHLFDEISTDIILRELDTISDFVEYLRELEGFQGIIRVDGGEEELLGSFILNQRKLPADSKMLFVLSGVWDEVSRKPEFLARKAADRFSYAWDRLIEFLSENLTYSVTGPPPTLDEAELVVRTMARETRFGRRILAGQFADWHRHRASRSRIVPALSGVVYVFLATRPDHERKARIAELEARCFVARGLRPEAKTVVGLGTEEYGSEGFSFDVVYYHLPVWTDAHTEDMQALQAKFGIFSEVRETRVSGDEFPIQGPPKQKHH